MLRNRKMLAVLVAAAGSLMAEDQPSADKPWSKPVPEWTADDAHRVMTDSPWVKTTTPTVDRQSNQGQRRSGGGSGGRSGGIGIGGVGIGFPGVGGMGRRGGGGGYPGGGYPGGGNSGGGYPDRTSGADSAGPPMLTLRWESALPIREAELKGRDVDAPVVDENHYAVAVIGVPSKLLKPNSRAMEDELRKQAVLKRDGKKDFNPSSVQILERDAGPVIVFLFPRSTEISKSDRRVEFDAQIGSLKLAEPFYLEDMVYDGKLAL